MPRQVLTAPGFFGKLPLAGDFVSRRLPPGFVDVWDRWISRHLARRPLGAPLCFLHPATPAGAMTGVVLESRDRGGRRFPLTLAARSAPRAYLPAAAVAWHATLIAAGEAATGGDIGVEALDARLGAMAGPPVPDGPDARGLLLWRPGAAPRETEAEAPEPILDALLASGAEAG
jgi:type VI secretion system protein ImpM